MIYPITSLEYLTNLKMLCTQKQKDLFDIMYPDGVDKKQLTWAITQLENTLKDLNSTGEEIRSLKKELHAANEDIIKIEKVKELQVEQLTKELNEANLRIEMLNNPINIDNADVQEKLDFLRALEIAGVDNWDGYDYAREVMEDKEG